MLEGGVYAGLEFIELRHWCSPASSWEALESLPLLHYEMEDTEFRHKHREHKAHGANLSSAASIAVRTDSFQG